MGSIKESSYPRVLDWHNLPYLSTHYNSMSRGRFDSLSPSRQLVVSRDRDGFDPRLLIAIFFVNKFIKFFNNPVKLLA